LDSLFLFFELLNILSKGSKPRLGLESCQGSPSLFLISFDGRKLVLKLFDFMTECGEDLGSYLLA
jgi:hypothetical protein